MAGFELVRTGRKVGSEAVYGLEALCARGGHSGLKFEASDVLGVRRNPSMYD